MDRRGIRLQLLSSLPKPLDALRSSRGYAASLVRLHPKRFGMLVALPTDNPEAALDEIRQAVDDLGAGAFAVTCRYNEVYQSDPMLNQVWAGLDRGRATVFAHV